MPTSIHYEDHSEARTTPAPHVRPPASAAMRSHTRAWRKAALWAAITAGPAAATLLAARRSKWLGALVGGGAVLAAGAFRWQLARLFTDEPDYEIVPHARGVEIRAYPSRVEAHTQVDAPRFEIALEYGFRRLFAYLQGANRAHEALRMTTPVTSRGEKLAMTAPLIASDHEGSYTLAFVMPPGRDLASLPAPTDHEVRLRDVPARQVAVLRFRGRHDGKRVAAAERELLRALVAEGLTPIGKPTFAAFDPPTTLPILRRNEIWVEVTGASAAS
jgi:hypothetical protein